MPRFNLDLSAGAAGWLEFVSERDNVTKTDIVRRAMGLFEIAREQQLKGRVLGFVPEDKAHLLETRVVGITEPTVGDKVG